MRHPPQNTRDINNTAPLGRRPGPHLLRRQPLLLQHLPNHRALTQPHAPNIDIIHPIPRLHAQIRRLGPRIACHPRTVDRILDAAELLDPAVDHVLDLLLVGRVGLDAEGLHVWVQRLEAGGRFFQPGGVEVGEDQARAAFVDEGAGAAPADSGGAACDEGDAVHDVGCHFVLGFREGEGERRGPFMGG